MVLKKVGERPVLIEPGKEKEVENMEQSEETKGELLDSEEKEGLINQADNSRSIKEILSEPIALGLGKIKENETEIIDLTNVVSAKAQASPARGRGKGSSSSFKVINTTASGKRVVVKAEIVEYFGTDDIEIAFDEDSMILAAKGANIGNVYTLRVDKKNYVLYNSALVVEITEYLELDFTNTTTVGLDVLKASTADGRKVIKLTK